MIRNPLFVMLMLLLVFASAAVVGAQPENPGDHGLPGRSGTAVNWTPDRIAIEGQPGSVQSIAAGFDTNGSFGSIQVRITPGLDGIVSTKTDRFESLDPGNHYGIELSVAIPESAEPGTVFDGTLHLRERNRTLARPLPIEVNVIERDDTVVHTLTMEEPVGNGTVDPPEGTHDYASGTLVALEAFSDPGWTLDHWRINGAAGAETSSATVTMDQDLSVQAIFKEVPTVQTLEPGGKIVGIDGVTFGAPAGSIAEDVDVEIRQIGDPTVETPLPDGWNEGGMEMIGGFYEVIASDEIVAPHGHYLMLGLPVPEGVSIADLAVAVLTPPDSVISHGDLESSMRWLTQRGQYDEESGLFGTLVPFAGSEPRVYGLVSGAGYAAVELPEGTETSTLPALDEQEFGGFQVECTNSFVVNPCTEDHRDQTEAALTEAYTTWVETLGFGEPRLQHTLVEIDFASDDAPSASVLFMYDYLLAYHERHNGVYAIEDGIAVTFFPSDASHPDPDDAITRHELFHALQYGYQNTFDKRESAVEAIVEGTATAAEMSIDSLTRSNRSEFPGREPRHVDIGILRDLPSSDVHAYSTQDFWVYVGRRIAPSDPQISYLIPLFERGSQRADLDQMLRDDSPFESLSDAYWNWVRNQSFEKTQPIGTDESGNSIPADEQCSWSGHGSPEPFILTPDINSFGMSFDLEPLTASVFEITLQQGADPRTVQAAIDTDEVQHEGVQVKFYLTEDAGTGTCVNRSAAESRLFDVEDDDLRFFILVANTNASTEATDIELDISVVNDMIFRAPDGREIANFGHAVESIGDRVLVGAPRHGAIPLEPVWGTGQAYLFESNGTYLHTFAAPDPQDGAQFGHSIASVGENVLIGAPAHDTSAGAQAGAVYLFDGDGVHLQTFTAPDGQQFARFGVAVASVGDTIAIAADSHATGGGNFAGQVYLFATDGTYLRTLALPEGEISSGFGRSLAAVGDNILIGTSLGRAYLFDTNGNELHVFEDPDSPALTWFGASVAGIGENVLIGATAAQLTPGFDAGRVYLYDSSGNLLQSFTAPDAQVRANFGHSITAVGENILVGAPDHDTDAGSRAGRAYLFGPGGDLLQAFTAPDGQASAQFGVSVATSGESILIGARQHDTIAGESAGQVYLFTTAH